MTTRHPSLDDLCTTISRILIGRHAEQLLADPLPETGAVVILPLWVWRTAKTDLGRKDRAQEGGRYLMPVRIDYPSSNPLLVTDNTNLNLDWTAAGIGHELKGTLQVQCDHTITAGRTIFVSDNIPVSIQLTPASQPSIARHLKRLADLGHHAEWSFRANSEAYLRNTIHRAHSRVSANIKGANYGLLLDDIRLAQIVDEMSIGSDTQPGAVTRLINRIIQPQTFARVDPLRYVATSLRRDAEDAIKRTVGDPRIGIALRRYTAQHQPKNLETLIAGWNEKNPRNMIGPDRAIAALTVDSEVNAISQTDLVERL